MSSVDETQQIRSREPFEKGQKTEMYKCEIERANMLERQRTNTLQRLSRTVGGLQVGITGRAVGGGIILKVEKEGEHVYFL